MTKQITEQDLYKLHSAVLKQLHGNHAITDVQYNAAFGIVEAVLVEIENQGHICLDGYDFGKKENKYV